MLSKEIIEKNLPDTKISVLDMTDSTNAAAKRAAIKGEALPRLICAEEQSAGRGRMGRSFYSPKGTGLYMSYAFENTADMADAVTITSAAAVAVCRAVEKLCSVDCKIKWVNDIYINNRKVCGILTEAVTQGSKTIIIVGIGVNCTTEIFPEDICLRAGSVGKLDRNILASAIVSELNGFIADISGRKWLDEYKKRSLVIGENINYTESGITHSARAVDIDENGALIVLENGQTKKLSTGEITVRIG